MSHDLYNCIKNRCDDWHRFSNCKTSYKTQKMGCFNKISNEQILLNDKVFL